MFITWLNAPSYVVKRNFEYVINPHHLAMHICHGACYSIAALKSHTYAAMAVTISSG